MPAKERGTQLEALLKMIRELMRHPATIVDLAGQLDLDRRTIYRYVDVIERSGIRVRKEDGSYRADAGDVRKALGL